MSPRTLPAELLAAFPDVRVRTAVRLNQRPGATAVDASKLGGDLLWPAGEPWPHCSDHDMTFAAILQLRADEVPEVGFPPGTDLVQLLWCPMDHVEQGYGPRVRALWRAAGEVTSVGPTPVPGRDLPGFLPGQCRIDPDRVEEIPDLRELGEDRAAAIDAWLRAHWGGFGVAGAVEPATDDDTPYLGEVAASPVSKVGGHPAWIQDPIQRRCACGRDMEYLLTLASSDADPSRWRAGDRANEGSALDRSLQSLLAASLGGEATAVEEATSPEEAQALVQRALALNPDLLTEVRALVDAAVDGDADSLPGLPPSTELMLGDLGSVYVFVCRHCEDSPVDAELQMT